jgi:predicted MFS family arabinose efflux permease
VPLAVWRVRSLLAGAGLMVGVTGMMSGAFFLNSLYLQDVLHLTPLQTGLAFFPFAAVIVAASHLGSRLLAHLTTRSLLVLGLIATAGGLLLLARAPEQASYPTDVLPGFVALGAGLGLAFVAIPVTALADVAADAAGLASGLMMTGHEIGAALGVGVFSAIASAGAAQAGLTAGYAQALVAAAGAAVILILLALRAVPAVAAPVGAAHAMLHGG